MYMYVYTYVYIRWGHWIRNATPRDQTLEDSLSDEGGGGTHGRSTIGVPLDSRPWIPYPKFPYPMPSTVYIHTYMDARARVKLPTSPISFVCMAASLMRTCGSQRTRRRNSAGFAIAVVQNATAGAIS